MDRPIIMMEYGLAIVTVVAIYYIARYYMMKASLKSATEQMKQIEQNPEDNRILLVAHANRNMERFLLECNHYIGQNQEMRIDYANRERKLRRQIEGISHDLRTPLTSLLGYLEMLEWEELGEDDRASLEVVERKAKNLQDLISNFYDLSRLELDDYHLNMEPVELSRFVRECMLHSYDDLDRRGLAIEVECEKTVFMNADKNALQRVLNNMIQNAIRYAESRLRVAVEVKEAGQACIVFENDTTTLKEEEIPHLFERFYMSDASRHGQGTGLGLTINKLLAEAMGGQAEANLEKQTLRIIYSFPMIEDPKSDR